MMEWLPDGLVEWTSEHPTLLRAALLSSVFMFVGSLLALPFLVSALPTDYFASKCAPPSRVKRWHPALRLLLLGVKNVLGALFLIAGLVMLVTPGQGILCILIGLSFLNFPGKRRLELWIVRKPRVLRTLNWMRGKTGKPALEVYSDCESSGDSTE